MYKAPTAEFSGTAGYTWQTTDGNEYLEHYRTSNKEKVRELGATKGQSKSVGPSVIICPGATDDAYMIFIYTPGAVSASLDFIFEGHSSGNSVLDTGSDGSEE